MQQRAYVCRQAPYDKRLTTSMACGGGFLISEYLNVQANLLTWTRV
jgi:hypothetical protein